ncbi:MAG TPA: glycoside hydrolase family 97 C-terminal domain-containing protein, partial [Draconibacterium sp.]|nr:glycoside hydrolase family 97 C-terminal domain-containing protein [Draconibacterium sp.]
HGNTWYVAGANAQKETVKLKAKLPMISVGKELKIYSDDANLNGKVTTEKLNKNQEVELTIPTNGGVLIIGQL